MFSVVSSTCVKRTRFFFRSHHQLSDAGPALRAPLRALRQLVQLVVLLFEDLLLRAPLVVDEALVARLQGTVAEGNSRLNESLGAPGNSSKEVLANLPKLINITEPDKHTTDVA